MHIIFRVIGWISLIIGILLCLLGVASLPAGGLMFAMPFFFLMPGIVLTLFGGLFLFFTRVKVSTIRNPGQPN